MNTKKVTFYKNNFFGDVTNESDSKMAYQLLFSFEKTNKCFSFGVNYDNFEFKLYETDSNHKFYLYKIISAPFNFGFTQAFQKIYFNYSASIIPSLVIEEFYSQKFSQGGGTKANNYLNEFHFSGGFGVLVGYQVFNKFMLFVNFCSRITINPFKRPYPVGEHWINYSSFNFGLGIKYSFK